MQQTQIEQRQEVWKLVSINFKFQRLQYIDIHKLKKKKDK